MTAPTFEPIPLPVARLDAIRHLVEVNPAWVELFANAEAAQVGRCFDEIISGRDAAGQRAYRHGLSTQKSGRFSFYASIETAATPTLMYLRLCRVDSGWFVLAEPVHHDDVNAELLSERERWRSVLHGASEGIAVLDDHGRFVEVNTRFLDLVAPRAPRGALLDDQGIIGWSLMEVVPAPLALALGARLASGLHRRSLVTRVVVGATHLELTVSSTSLAGGRFTGTCLTVHDRTADHRLREVNSELSASLAFLEELYRVLPGVLLVFDSEGVITRVNEAAHTVLGYDTNTLVGRPVATLFPAAAPICSRRSWRRACSKANAT